MFTRRKVHPHTTLLHLQLKPFSSGKVKVQLAQVQMVWVTKWDGKGKR